jgi:hypothetical protein
MPLVYNFFSTPHPSFQYFFVVIESGTESKPYQGLYKQYLKVLLVIFFLKERFHLFSFCAAQCSSSPSELQTVAFFSVNLGEVSLA